MRQLVFWLVLAATLAVYLVMVLWSLPKLAETAGGLTMFDMRPAGYSFVDAHEILTALGGSGREFYLGTQQVLDTVYPPLLAFALALSFVRLFSGKILGALVFLALAAAGFDLMENRTVADMLLAGPDALSAEMVDAASRWTLLKSGAVTVAMLAFVAGLVRAGWRRYTGKASRQSSSSSSVR